MFAKKFKKRFDIQIGTLPDDVLYEVFRHATWVPYGIEPSDMVSRRLQSSYPRDRTKNYCASLVTRRHLTRVCRRWYHLALSYLYEWIQVSGLKNLEVIVQALNRPLASSPQVCVGWRTRRLDIDFRWTREETMEQWLREGDLVLRILHAVPNLQVLMVGDCGDRYWAKHPFSHTYCPKLEFFNWIGKTEIIDLEDWVHFVQSHPNLIAINFPITRYSSSDRILQAPPHYALRELTVDCHDINPIFIGTTFPSLNRLNLDAELMYKLSTSNHGTSRPKTQTLPSLTILQINLIDRSVALGINFGLGNITHLPQFLPNLCRIEFVLPEWPEFWPEIILPSGISVLGIRVYSGAKPKRLTVKQLLRGLKRVVRAAESLLTVQFLDEVTMLGVCAHTEHVARCGEVQSVLTNWLDPDGNIYEIHV